MSGRVEDDILRVLKDPRILATLPPQRTTDLFARARRSAMLGRIAARAVHRDQASALPERIQGVLESALTAASAFQRMPQFETDRIKRVLAPLGHDIILLKGSAYVMAGLPAALGRTLSDVDILLPRALCAQAEALLLASGWTQIKSADYDQMYFREWMHELPPLRHAERRTIIDLHHTILPPTGRLRPDPQLLIDAAVPLPGSSGLRVLAPADMVLHNVVHHFQDGEMQHSLRELVDLDDLIRHFGPMHGFWDSLLGRTEKLGFGRPAFYAFRYVRQLLDTPIPTQVVDALRRYAPPTVALKIMDGAFPRCLLASGRLPHGPLERGAAKFLYLRAQWLKMPPSLLARHAAHKLLRKLPQRHQASADPEPQKPDSNRPKA